MTTAKRTASVGAFTAFGLLLPLLFHMAGGVGVGQVFFTNAYSGVNSRSISGAAGWSRGWRADTCTQQCIDRHAASHAHAADYAGRACGVWLGRRLFWQKTATVGSAVRCNGSRPNRSCGRSCRAGVFFWFAG